MTYEGMQARLRDRLSAEVGPMQWANRENFSGAGCADFPHVGGQSLILDGWKSEGNLPDTSWGDAVRIVAEVTGEYGFGTPRVVVDRPSDHEITATDQYGGHYLFGTAANTVLAGDRDPRWCRRARHQSCPQRPGQPWCSRRSVADQGRRVAGQARTMIDDLETAVTYHRLSSHGQCCLAARFTLLG